MLMEEQSLIQTIFDSENTGLELCYSIYSVELSSSFSGGQHLTTLYIATGMQSGCLPTPPLVAEVNIPFV